MEQWFGTSWDTMGFVAVSTVAMYVTLLVAVRLAGRRTLTRLSAFDVLVTVALGTLMSSTAVAADPSYLQATTAMVTLLTMQVLVAAARKHSERLQRLLEFAPEVVVRDGEVHLPSGPLTSQLSEGELQSRLRQHGVFDHDDLALVVLEPSGKVSVLRRSGADAGSASAG